MALRGTIEQRIDGWWLLMVPYFDMGPYSTREACERLQRDLWNGERKQGLRGKQRQLFDGLQCEPGQLDLF